MSWSLTKNWKSAVKVKSLFRLVSSIKMSNYLGWRCAYFSRVQDSADIYLSMALNEIENRYKVQDYTETLHRHPSIVSTRFGKRLDGTVWTRGVWVGHFHNHAYSQIAFGFWQPIKINSVFYEGASLYEWGQFYEWRHILSPFQINRWSLRNWKHS